MGEERKSASWARWQKRLNEFLLGLSVEFTADAIKQAFVHFSVGAVLAGSVVTTVPFAREHWQITTGAAYLLVSSVLLIRRTFHRSRGSKKELLHFKSLAESCGIEAIYPLNTAEEKEAGWKACVEKIAEVRNGELRLAVFTGASTFSYEPGEENHFSPLRDALDGHRGQLKILLMEIDCPAWAECVRAYGNGVEAREAKYKIDLNEAYNKAREFCEYLARKHHSQLKSIEVRAYDRPPLWKTVIMGEHIWVQHYFPGEHVDDRPAFVVNVNAVGGMAYALQSVFDYRWKMSKVVLHREDPAAVK